MSIIYLVRHAEADRTTPNYSLSKSGKEQAHRLGVWFRNTSVLARPEKFYSSDKPRTIETVKCIMEELEVSAEYLEIDKRFDENNPPKELTEEFQKSQKYVELINAGKRWNLGLDWEGKKEREEAFFQALNEVAQKEKSALIATHANIINYSMFQLFPDDLRIQNNVRTPMAALTILEYSDGKYSLKEFCSQKW